MKSFEAKVSVTSLLVSAIALSVTWWITDSPVSRAGCRNLYDGVRCSEVPLFGDYRFPSHSYQWDNLAPTFGVLIVSLGTPTLLILVRRNWKRPDES